MTFSNTIFRGTWGDVPYEVDAKGYICPECDMRTFSPGEARRIQEAGRKAAGE
jgi:hypothetical protein